MRIALAFVVAAAAGAVVARPARAVTIDFVAPDDGAHVGRQATLFVSTSEPVTKVDARMDAATATLETFDGRFWNGQISLTTVARGPKDLVITAYPATGAPVTHTAKVIRNDLPWVRIISPAADEVARPNVRVVIDCVDDDDPRGCAEMKVSAVADPLPTVLASGRERIDTTVSLAAWEGGIVTLRIDARDGDNGMTTQDISPLLVDGSPRLIEIDRGRGIVDGDAARTVLCTEGGLHLRQRSSGAIVTTMMPPPECAWVNSLTRHGVLYTARDQPNTTSFLVWDGNESKRVGTFVGGATARIFSVMGDFAAWRSGPTSVEIADLGRRVSRSLTMTSVGFPGGGLATINAKGDIVYVDVARNAPPDARLFGLFRSRADAIVEPLRQLPFGGFYLAIQDDGINTVFVARNNSISSGFDEAYLYRPDADELLSQNVGGTGPESQNLAVSGGWIAYREYRHTPPPSLCQLWVRSPAGVKTRIHEMMCAVDETHKIEGLSPDGDVMFAVKGRRMLSRAGAAPEAVSTAQGTPLYRNNAWLILMGTSLFHVDGTGPPGAVAVYQPPDAGAPTLDGAAGVAVDVSSDGPIDASPSADGDSPDGGRTATGDGCGCRMPGGPREGLAGLPLVVFLGAVLMARRNMKAPDCRS